MRSPAAAQVVIEVLGELLTLEVIAVLEFNSDRKRMSIIVRIPGGRWALSWTESGGACCCWGVLESCHMLRMPHSRWAQALQPHCCSQMATTAVPVG